MTVDELLRAFPGEARRSAEGERGRIEGFLPAAAIPSVIIGGRSYAVSFLFDRAGLLGAIRMSFAGAGTGAAPAYQELAASLSSAYGPPDTEREQSTPSGSWNRTSSWRIPDRLIELHGWRTELRESPILTLDMRAGDIRPQDEGGVVLTYRPGPSVRPRS
jgi:hypothetical protein